MSQLTFDLKEILVSTAIKRAARFVPGNHNCLTQAIAGQRMLARLHIPGNVVIGLRANTTGQPWDTHAWLVTPHGMVVGGEIADQFSPVTTYTREASTQAPLHRGEIATEHHRALARLVSHALAIEHGVLRDTSPLPPIDNAVVAVARYHRVDGLLVAHAQELGLAGPNERALLDQATANLLAGLLLAKGTATVDALFTENGFNHLVFKGIALSLLTHRESAARGAGDIDVLIEPAEVPRAHRMMVAEGFRPKIAFLPRERQSWKFWAFRDRELSYSKDGVFIDLHWKIAKNSRHTAPATSQLARSSSVLSGRSVIPTLSPGDALNACAVHIYLDYAQNLRLITDLVYLSRIADVALPDDVPPAGRQLVADVLEFTRQLLGDGLVPAIAGTPVASDGGVDYMKRMWDLNASRPLAEARPPSRFGERWGRLHHFLRYGGSPRETLRFFAQVFLAIPPYSGATTSTGILSAFGYRLRQIASGQLPYLQARRHSIEHTEGS